MYERGDEKRKQRAKRRRGEEGEEGDEEKAEGDSSHVTTLLSSHLTLYRTCVRVYLMFSSEIDTPPRIVHIIQ
jgi:hypothetical protein